MDLTINRLEFGSVSIAWFAPRHITPIGVWHPGLNGKTIYCLNCDLHYTIGDPEDGIHRVIPMFVDGKRFIFDGASIPPWLRWIPGFEPLGWHIWAVIVHDFICDHPEKLPRSIGDAFFLEILKATKPENYWQAVGMYIGVRLESTRQAWRRRLEKKDER